MQATGDVISMQAVGVVRDGATLLDHIDWAVDQDQRWVILGPNGAGKTTLLRVASTRLFPTRGTVDILGERLGAVDVFELRPRIGLSSVALGERIPAKEKARDVVLTASYGSVGRWHERYDIWDEVRADTVLAQVGCTHLADRTYGTLSEGERKRVQIARALMTDPEMLLLDEPAAGLDLGGREDLVGRLAAIAADPAAPTTVLVTHHVEEIPLGFTHVLLLRGGRVVASGPLHEAMTEASLSDTFGVALRLDYRDGRFAAQGKI
ncbi:MAG TPA: ABC transporter ATP-binding protein [Acidothermaceae bacterium]|nr:ABC transporter ATP-binding protein [Acidothermaceae bacterium]